MVARTEVVVVVSVRMVLVKVTEDVEVASVETVAVSEVVEV